MRVFISGGCKNGKSTFAQKLAKQQQIAVVENRLEQGEARLCPSLRGAQRRSNPGSSHERPLDCFAGARKDGSGTPLYYIATMAAADREDDERIIRHKKEREGWGFATIEQPRNISGILEKCDPSGSFLLDSLTALLANEMFATDGSFDGHAEERIAAQLQAVLSRVENIVVVSDYIYSDAMIYDPLTQAYRKSLAALDRLAAGICDVVLEAVYTQIIVHKGHEYKLLCSATGDKGFQGQ